MKLPNYTQISNEFIDNYMHKLSGNATKIFISISRKTIGWHKASDMISYSQLRELTGLSINTIKKTIKELIDVKLISQINTKYGYRYDLSINPVSKDDISNSDASVSNSDTAISNIDTPISNSDTNLYQNLTPQKKVKETSNKKTNKKENNSFKEGSFGKRVIDSFLSKSFFTDFAYEMKHIKRIIKYLEKDSQNLGVEKEDFTKQFLNTFWKVINDQQHWLYKTMFLPSSLSYNIYTKIKGEMNNMKKEITEEELDLINSVKFNTTL